MLELLHDKGHIKKQTKFEHSYPYDWRTKKPVILRGSKQWFMDTGSIQAKALEIVKSQVTIHPKSMAHGFENILKNRPYWCISRQRVWGVPIPVFYNEQEVPVITPEIVERLCDLTEKHGSIDFWWTMNESEILQGLDCSSNLKKG